MASTISAGTTSGTAIAIAGDTSGQLQLQTNGTTTALTINTAQGVQALNCIGVGNATPSTSGAGITFPATQSASSDANTLDDYEEGTWTPTVNSGTITVGNNAYIKVGRLVTVWAVISTFSDRSSASQITVGGFPFASASFGSVVGLSTLYRYCSTPPSFYLQATASSALIYSSSTSGYVTFNYNALTNSQSEIYINFTYEASA